MDDHSQRQQRADTYRRHARIHDRLARAYEVTANQHEWAAAHFADGPARLDSYSRADRARESAERSSCRSDALRAAAALQTDQVDWASVPE